MAVNPSSGKAGNLNADKVDGRDFGCSVGTLFHEGGLHRGHQASGRHPCRAHQDCIDEGRRLPSVEKLLTFRNRSGHDFAGPNTEWTSEIEYNGTNIGANHVSPSGSVG